MIDILDKLSLLPPALGPFPRLSESYSLPMNPDIAPLIQALDQADSAPKLAQATRRLAQAQHADAIPALVKVLGYNNPGAAVAAVEGLIQLGEKAAPYLLEHIDGFNYGARAWITRALAGIGDPRALEILLDAAQSDFALSVRRSAAKGLGHLRWERVDPSDLAQVQDRVLTALQEVAEKDGEWVVRYSAAAGLEALAQTQPSLKTQVIAFLGDRLPREPEAVVQARIQWALEKRTLDEV
jgi:phycocyanobilin lyase beta subunit